MMFGKNDEDPSWIFAIALLHILWKDCNLFSQTSLSEVHRREAWWGTDRLRDKVIAFKAATLERGWKM
jgi:hypothetical protein